ncbi:late embryogenesis abundant protein At1g64065-like [Cornus florida]|uniref:late embryogenesis abundant protein At1g64065-like n=1 Tax=Cornus florida TaxID=4283 RepID=UPI0028988214|nr:late embryogenesis abundant protein At1g64065-like [Cornus florida]
MAEKDQQVHPMPQSNNTPAKQDEEDGGTLLSKELRRKKRMKCLAYVVAFAVIQTSIILLFALTVMKIKTPKFRVRSATFESFNVVATTSPPSFDIKMNAELGVKNTNFGHYKFDNSTIYFFYKGTEVGSAVVSKARARARSTKKFNVLVGLSSTNLPSNSELGSDLSSGVWQLSSRSELKGKVELMKVMKKKKSTEMSCTLTISLADKAIRDLNCR